MIHFPCLDPHILLSVSINMFVERFSTFCVYRSCISILLLRGLQYHIVVIWLESIAYFVTFCELRFCQNLYSSMKLYYINIYLLTFFICFALTPYNSECEPSSSSQSDTPL